jgi:hypothetical protein
MERKMEVQDYTRYRLLHPTKEKETIYKEIISLHPKVDLKQFEEIINQDATPIEFMDHSAALRETLSFNQHCTGSKSSCVQALYNQMLSKNPICRKQREGYFGESNKNKT